MSVNERLLCDFRAIHPGDSFDVGDWPAVVAIISPRKDRASFRSYHRKSMGNLIEDADLVIVTSDPDTTIYTYAAQVAEQGNVVLIIDVDKDRQADWLRQLRESGAACKLTTMPSARSVG